ncbi:MAG TPA: nuclear transport factor 2 family protein [Steroidobacteraceae bacterium]
MRDREWWQQLCATIDAKDTRSFMSYLADDCEFRFANGPSVVGHAAIGGAVDAFWASIRASEHHVSHCWSGAASAVCEGTCTYTRHDGSTITLPFVDVLHFRGDEAERYFIYIDVTPLYAGTSV